MSYLQMQKRAMKHLPASSNPFIKLLTRRHMLGRWRHGKLSQQEHVTFCYDGSSGASWQRRQRRYSPLNATNWHAVLKRMKQRPL